MIVAVCSHENRQKFGKTCAGAQRYRCKSCHKTWTEGTQALDGMRIGMDRACQILGMLVEGMAIRSLARITDTDPHTVIDLLTMVGEKCQRFADEKLVDLHIDDVRCDEIWQFVYCKTATAERMKYVGGCGDSDTCTAIERNTKLMLAWYFGRRTLQAAHAFCRQLNKATRGRFHLSTDAYAPYKYAVTLHLGKSKVDYGQLVKVFGEAPPEERRKYSPAKIKSMTKNPVLGDPDPDLICTSHVERMNGTIRHFTKRMARLTCAFSKRWENHRAALALFFVHYNWCRVHKSLGGMTPAMAHGIATNVWSVRDPLERIE